MRLLLLVTSGFYIQLISCRFGSATVTTSLKECLVIFVVVVVETSKDMNSKHR